MKVMVAFEHRFLRTREGTIHTRSTFDHGFLSRYLQVFDEVVVLARVEDVDSARSDMPRADGPGVSFHPLPCYLGPWQYLLNLPALRRGIAAAAGSADAFVLRVSGAVGTLLWRRLVGRGLPYGVEVVADPWDALSPGSVRSVLRPLARQIQTRDLARQCRDAIAAAYVTAEGLQRRYPPGGWTTHYSSVELPGERIREASVLDIRAARVADVRAGNRRWCIGYVGTLWQLYKAPDSVIEAFASCVDRGLDADLVMVGDGQYREQLEQLASRLGVAERVEFAGAVERGAAVDAQLDRLDLMVLPSRQEGLPRIVIEAMARAVPCIASTVGGIPELLPAEDMVAPADAGALAAKISEVLRDDARLAAMSRRNLDGAQVYRADELEKRRIEFYRRVAEAVGSPRPPR